MMYPVADEEQDNEMALRAAVHGRWVELRQHRKPRQTERHNWIRALLVGEELRSRDDDVSGWTASRTPLFQKKSTGGRPSTKSSSR